MAATSRCIHETLKASAALVLDDQMAADIGPSTVECPNEDVHSRDEFGERVLLLEGDAGQWIRSPWVEDTTKPLDMANSTSETVLYAAAI
ncbi:hypothetical protein ANO14919_012580 [Xylariales sp. No.14919]|nr:hypothetical protein ANO14919_012580 [Xylariales sp. No.14919]